MGDKTRTETMERRDGRIAGIVSRVSCLKSSLFHWILLALAVGCAWAGMAAEVSVQDAARAVDRWLTDDPALGCPLGNSVATARTCETPSGARFHVVCLDGGGFVIASSDTRQEPIVAFSSDSDLVEDETNPLWALLCRDFENRRGATARRAASVRAVAPGRQAAAPLTAVELKWSRLLSSDARPLVRAPAARTASPRLVSAKPSVSDLRVAPLVQSAWGQSTAAGGDCFNTCTPSNYLSGCVATVAAQIMRYFAWPTRAVQSVVNEFCDTPGGAAVSNLTPVVNGMALTVTLPKGAAKGFLRVKVRGYCFSPCQYCRHAEGASSRHRAAHSAREEASRLLSRRDATCVRYDTSFK